MRHNPASGIMAKFVRYGRIIVIAGVEIGKLGHDHMIAARLIIGLRSEVFKGDGDASEKRVQLGIPLIGIGCGDDRRGGWIFRLDAIRSEEHTSELQSLMRISYAVFCLKKKNSITYMSN